MDALKLIPQLFFDAIARVVPGLFLMVGFDALTGASTLERMMTILVPNGSLHDSAVVSAFVVATAGYVVGHLLSPAVRWLEHPSSPEACRTRVARWLPSLLPFRRPHSKFHDAVWLQYDWLRLERSEAGDLVARIRAEYTMYGGLAVALIVLALTAIVLLAGASLQPPVGSNAPMVRVAGVLLVSVVGAAVMLRRHFSTYHTFGRSVCSFYRVAEGSDRWKPELLTPDDYQAWTATRSASVGAAF